MNRRELVKAVATHTDIDPKTVDAVLKGFQEVTTAVAAKGEPVTISGFAKFYRQDRKARPGRNPATGEKIRIPAKKVAKITPMKGFKDAVLKPSLAPKLARGVWPPAAEKAAKAPAKTTTAKKAAATKKTTTAKKAAATKKATAAKATAKATTAKKAPAKKAARR